MFKNQNETMNIVALTLKNICETNYKHVVYLDKDNRLSCYLQKVDICQFQPSGTSFSLLLM